MKKIVPINQNILEHHFVLAEAIKQSLIFQNILTINLMASPGGGKTSFIEKTIIELLTLEHRPAVIEGDVVTIDVERIEALTVPVVLANTGGACHLDSIMIEQALKKMDLKLIDTLLIENVGNLVCPANFPVGARLNVVIASVPEGDDKPLKYPGMFTMADVVILNKADYLTLGDFSMETFSAGILKVNPKAQTFIVSCKTGQGIPTWITWLEEQRVTQAN